MKLSNDELDFVLFCSVRFVSVRFGLTVGRCCGVDAPNRHDHTNRVEQNRTEHKALIVIKMAQTTLMVASESTRNSVVLCNAPPLQL